MEKTIRELAYRYWNGDIDYIDEKYASLVIEYMENHKENFKGYRSF